MKSTLTERQKSWLILFALWAFLLLLAGLRPLAVPDEGRYGEVGRWMLQSGDWLTPRLNGLPFFHKPPLLGWLEALSMGIFGVGERALRLVPAAHAGLMLAALYLAARQITTETVARRAAIMLGASMAFLLGGQYVNHDMMVATWIGVAIWCFAFSFMAGDKPDPSLARLGFVACALGLLSKGLIGFVLPGMVLLVWLIWTRQLNKAWRLPWASGLALFAVIGLPWFVLVEQKYPGFFDYAVIQQQFGRYKAASFNNVHPWWFYLAVLVLMLFPWVFFAGFQVRRKSVPAVSGAWHCLFWIWIFVILAFFSVPSSKLAGYILPVLPPLALLAALGWERTMAPRRWGAASFAGLGALNLVLATVMVLKVGDVTRQGRSTDVALVLACEAYPSDTVYVSGAFAYDLPFYAQTTRPMVVLADWPLLRAHAGDDWHRELFEGADFDRQAAQVLQPQSVLPRAGTEPGNWLVLRNSEGAPSDIAQEPPNWRLYYRGAGWTLFASAPERPKSAEQKGLPGCHANRDKQGQ